ncbi:MAG: exodeoxyribonuclease III [Actinomycetota bacterium]
MKIVTWNVNSIRQRLPRALALLERYEPDVVCLQETKVIDEDFPVAEFADAGYTSASFGQKSYNGVAILARDPVEDVVRGFPGDPVATESRILAARVGGLHLVDVYAINGKAVATPSYELKLSWLDALANWIGDTYTPDDALIVTGDFNIAPDDRDVHDADLWRGKNLASEPERERIGALLQWGLVDLQRLHADGPGPFTWWDYRMGAFHKGWGLRIDLALGTKTVADRCVAVEVDREERKPSTGEGKPSDHAPVIVTLADR